MTITTPTATRRAMLAAIPAVAAFAAVPVASAATVDRSRWNVAFAAMEKADADELAFNPVYDRIFESWKSSRPAMDGIDWKPFPFENRDHVARVLDLDQRWKQFLAGEGKVWASANPDNTKAEMRAALDSIQAYRDACDKHDQETGMAAAEDRWEALGDAAHAARGKVMETPAPDLAALRWKLQHLLADDGSESVSAWSMDYIAQTKADIARLMGDA